MRDFRTDYLLKVFRFDARSRTFEEAPLENQIDRTRILADATLRRDFRTWLLDPGHLGELDRGTILIPEKYLANGAIAADPGRALRHRACSRHSVWWRARAPTLFSGKSDVIAALKKAAESGIGLQNIRSVAGFERRLNDITCSGCHQTRGIGGFHFPGVDWMAAKPSNSTVVPASPHFFGDQIRRRDILAALRDGRQPDYSRGFSSRPQLRGSTELAGTGYDDGWGAHCYRQKPGAGTMTGVSSRGPAPRGSPVRWPIRPCAWECASSRAADCSQAGCNGSRRFARRVKPANTIHNIESTAYGSRRR